LTRGIGGLSLDFLMNSDSTEPEMAGVWGALKGSFLTILVTMSIAFPIGVLSALYLEEFARRNRWTDMVEVTINNLAAVPSIIFGLLGLAVFLNTLELPRSAPLVGGELKELLLGGEAVGPAALTRFYALHCFVLPTLTVMLTSYHLWRIRKDGGLAVSDRVADEAMRRAVAAPPTPGKTGAFSHPASKPPTANQPKICRIPLPVLIPTIQAVLTTILAPDAQSCKSGQQKAEPIRLIGA